MQILPLADPELILASLQDWVEAHPNLAWKASEGKIALTVFIDAETEYGAGGVATRLVEDRFQ